MISQLAQAVPAAMWLSAAASMKLTQRRMFAGSGLPVMPSRYEPCGLRPELRTMLWLIARLGIARADGRYIEMIQPRFLFRTDDPNQLRWCD